ncbi:histidinol-phosphate transaminase [Halodesulfovibrio marinisediminis]|uniref:Histidinol-phosphate aminotransferase n=1 Tax=Halodesulfovibrio marinisediminis DSM 17456 TaxID=1121457 RepID=A0A1N6ID80_9BACT|nr:histidinol-phosphate transaminase [Halodesulfovibrio marinisediminis]SIO29963.1 histidinol phosphate aminotransferase apoenzyme [Halodesulfovibrio marinisediminis DSM 17456]
MSSKVCEAIREEVKCFSPYTAGKSIDEVKEAYGLNSIIKLASNENPLGTSPRVQDVIKLYASSTFRYAQVGTPNLVDAIAHYFHIPDDTIVSGNGSDEVIDMLIRVKATPGKNNIVAFKPCFSMYQVLSRLNGVEFRQAALNDDFTFDWDGLLKLVDDQTSIVFITTPDNPSGYAPKVEEILALHAKLPKSCLLVVDEAYMDFAEDLDRYSMLPRFTQYDNVCVLRTFSKCFGLAGLRLGFGAMNPQLAEYLRRIRAPFNVNILAEQAGIAVLQDTPFIEETLRVTREGRAYLTKELEALDFNVYPSLANFIMVEAPKDGSYLTEELLKRGLIIRPLVKGYNLPKHLRITIGTDHENQVLISALKEILNAE